MILKISCPSCHHVGLADAATLPRSLTCSACGTSRCVDSSDGRAITSTARFEEWLSGERERPHGARVFSQPGRQAAGRECGSTKNPHSPLPRREDGRPAGDRRVGDRGMEISRVLIGPAR